MLYDEHSKLRTITRELLLDLLHNGYYTSDQEFLEDNITNEYARGVINALEGPGKSVDRDIATLLKEELSKFSIDEIRYIFCGWYMDIEDLEDDTPPVTASRFVSLIKWVRDSDYVLTMLPRTFLANYEWTELHASTVERAGGGNEVSKGILDRCIEEGRGGLFREAYVVLYTLLGKLSHGRRMSRKVFRRDLFDTAVESFIKKGDRCIKDLKSILDEFDNDAYVNAAAGLLERNGTNIIENGDDIQTYIEGLSNISMHLRWINASETSLEFWFD